MSAPLLKNNPFVDRIIAVSGNGNKHDTIRIINNLQFDTLLCLVNDSYLMSILSDLKRIPTRIGPLSKPSVLFKYSHPVIQKRSRSEKNEADYNLEMLEIFGITPAGSCKPKIYLEQEEIDLFVSKFRDRFPFDRDQEKTIVLHPGMRGSALNMKDTFFRSLLSRLTEGGYKTFITGYGSQEAEANEELIRSIPSTERKKKTVNFTNLLDLRELSVLISIADLFIGPSTGPTHIANAVDTPLISFYPPITVQSATRWQPYLAESSIFTPEVNCEQKYKCIGPDCPDYYCMDKIRIEDVMDSVKLFLEAKS